MKVQPLLALVGPTGTGKTEAAVRIAEALGGEIVNVDASTVYRGMDAGTAKPTPEERSRVPHHLIDVADPEEPFSVARYQRLAFEAIEEISGRGRPTLLVGGSGLYYRAVVDRLEFPGTDPSVRTMLEAEASAVGPEALHARLRSFDPAAAGRMDPSNSRRTVRALEVAAITGRPFSSFGREWVRYRPGRVRAAAVSLPRDALYRRIENRASESLDGILAETRRLLERGAGPFLTSIQAIGYAEAMEVLAGRMERPDALRAVIRRVKALARRQMAWFRRDPRVQWFVAGEGGAAEIADQLSEFMGQAMAGTGRRTAPAWAR
ncbi:MAG TPA: tRNA (adenosine(37)-N6)-dimethylallyltransferase MiaA [Actinomycetota bacterium]